MVAHDRSYPYSIAESKRAELTISATDRTTEGSEKTREKTKVKTEGDNPTIGLVLCADTSEDMARYSILHENPQLFQAKYMLYLPTTEELAKEIERQRAIYMLQQDEA